METKIENEAERYFQIKEIGVLIKNLVNLSLVVAALVFFVYLIWGGLDWITSQGDKSKYEQARQKITAALIGLAIVACAWLIWLITLYFLGIGQTGGGKVIFDLNFKN